MKNKSVSELLYKIADLMDVKGEIFFKTRAYRMAAQTIETLDEDIEVLVAKKRLQEIPGIGKAIAKKITEFVETGNLVFYEKLKKEVPEALLLLLDIPGLGPKKVAALYQKLGISTIEQLRVACLQGRLRDLDGFGEITERNILRGISLREKTSGRVLLNVAYDDGLKVVSFLKICSDVIKVSIAGSLRRMKETIGDIDVLASSDSAETVMDFFVGFGDIDRVLLKGSTKTSVVLNDNVQVDLRVVKPESFGAALQYFTGSKEHNVHMRSIAIKQGFKLNEYGLFDKDSEKFVVGKTEKQVYNKLGLDFVDPELRENTGEIEFAKKHTLPKLIKKEDIRGDLHVHSSWSDGSDSISDIVVAAQNKGYSYIGIADHSQSLKVANGLSVDRVKKKIKEINRLNKKFDDITILCGTECDIKSDGSLDYPDSVLKMFDYVYVGVHVPYKVSDTSMTQRIISGMENEHVNFLAHPTCRLIGRRPPFEIDFDQVFDAAKNTGVGLEINSFPDRLDLNDLNIRRALQKKNRFVIGTDSHSIENLDYMRFGVATARRGWLTKSNVINTYSLKELKSILGRG